MIECKRIPSAPPTSSLEDISSYDPKSLPDEVVKEDTAISTFHNKLSDSKRIIQCKYCSQQYLHRSSLSRHISTVHSEKTGTIDCELCTER